VKYLIIVLSVILCMGCIMTSTSTVESYPTVSKQIRVAVLDFENKTKYGARSLADSAAEILVSEMSQSGAFIIVERKKLDAILQEMELQLSDLTEGDRTSEVGKLLNCEYLLSGVVSNFGLKTEGHDVLLAKQKTQTAQAEVDIKVMSVETAEIVFSGYGRGVATKKISSAFGMGGTGGYDETLAGECLRAAISDAVRRQIEFFRSRQ